MGNIEFTAEQMDAAHELMQRPKILGSNVRFVEPRALLHAIAREHGISYEQLVGKARHKSLVAVRKLAYRALRDAGYSYPEIGTLVGGRDHTTVMAGLEALGTLGHR